MMFKRFIAMFLVIVVMAGSMVLSVNATGREQITTEETESISKTANISEDCVDYCGEVTQGSMNAVEAQASFTETLKNCSTINSADLNDVERIFNCNLSVASAEKILDQGTDQIYTRYTCKDKTELSFDENGELFKISTIYAETSPRIGYAVRGIAQDSVLSAKEAKKQCVDMMPKICEMFNITDDYPLTDVYDFDTDYVIYTFKKLLDNGIHNPYQAVKVVYNKRLGKLSIARKVDIEPNAITPRINEEEAIIAATKMTGDSVTFDQARLTYIDQRFTNNGSDVKSGSSVCYLVYKVTTSNNNLIVYLDALTGECIGIDVTMSENAGAFGIQESNDPTSYNYTFYRDENGKVVDYLDSTINTLNSRRTIKIWLCVLAMRRLGYNPSKTIKSDKSLISDVRDYLNNDSNAYAFYFTGHGSPDVLGFKTNGWIRRKSDVTGNWHFVFLDSCSTAVNTGWADAFKINGYSRRAFLGWNGIIDSLNGYLFALKFWPLIDGNRSVRQAAVDAAAGVDGDGTTPIRFYGDRSYTGRAWK